jgi:hypothetical protein
MKKKILSIAMVTMVAVAAAWSYSSNNNDVALADLALSNVEALANGESSEAFTGATGCVAVWENVNCKKPGENAVHTYARPK